MRIRFALNIIPSPCFFLFSPISFCFSPLGGLCCCLIGLPSHLLTAGRTELGAVPEALQFGELTGAGILLSCCVPAGPQQKMAFPTEPSDGCLKELIRALVSPGF